MTCDRKWRHPPWYCCCWCRDWRMKRDGGRRKTMGPQCIRSIDELWSSECWSETEAIGIDFWRLRFNIMNDSECVKIVYTYKQNERCWLGDCSRRLVWIMEDDWIFGKHVIFNDVIGQWRSVTRYRVEQRVGGGL